MIKKRLLTTIMFTDIVGHTSLLAHDESIAAECLEYNSKLHSFLIEKFNGIKLKEIGDGTLSSFINPIDAANCAIAIQQYVMHQSKYQLRIGLHLGDVLACSNDDLGNSVSISARIQGATEPTKIAISKMLFDSISETNLFNFKEIGEVYLKGLIEPYTLYEIIYSPITPPVIDYHQLEYSSIKQPFPMPSAIILFFIAIFIILIIFKLL